MFPAIDPTARIRQPRPVLVRRSFSAWGKTKLKRFSAIANRLVEPGRFRSLFVINKHRQPKKCVLKRFRNQRPPNHQHLILESFLHGTTCHFVHRSVG
jgi:hypothetical protein